MSAPAQVFERRSGATLAADEVPATADDLIVQMSQSAGVIFVGHAVEVRQPESGLAEAAAEGVVEVDFVVDQAVQGAAQGSTYTLREWGGLWAAKTGRYRVGQRLLLLLHAPGLTGLSSPVHGAEGLIPLRGAGQAPGPDDGSSTASQWMVDVRWLQAQTLQTEGLRPGVPVRDPLPVRGGRGLRSESLASMRQPLPQTEDSLLVHALPGPWIEQSSTVQTEPLTHILSLCVGAAGSKNASK